MGHVLRTTNISHHRLFPSAAFLPVPYAPSPLTVLYTVIRMTLPTPSTYRLIICLRKYYKLYSVFITKIRGQEAVGILRTAVKQH